jgi:branched-chain amino acid transport system permease protein
MILLLLMPKFVSKYFLRTILFMLIYLILAESFNIISGYTGYISFGHIAFFGLGAYFFVILYIKFGLSIYLSIIISIIASVLTTMLFSFLFKLKGAYFAIASAALSEIVKLLILNLPEGITGGSYGIWLPDTLELDIAYYISLLISLFCILTAFMLERSRIGLALFCLKDDEIAAGAIGINVPKYRLYAYLLSTIFPACEGIIYSLSMGYIEPIGTFSWSHSNVMIASALFGGLGTYMGPVIGVVSLYWILEALWLYLPYAYLVVFGLLIIIVCVFLPRGIWHFVESKFLKRLSSKKVTVLHIER